MGTNSAVRAAAARAMHAKYGVGHQTGAQLMAERRNLQKARLGRAHSYRKRGNRTIRSLLIKQVLGKRLRSSNRLIQAEHRRGQANLVRAQHLHYLQVSGKHPIGVRYIHGRKNPKQIIRKPTGMPKKFRSEIAPGGYLKRTKWGSARQHHYKSHMVQRHKRFREVKKWRHRGNKYTAR